MVLTVQSVSLKHTSVLGHISFSSTIDFPQFNFVFHLKSNNLQKHATSQVILLDYNIVGLRKKLVFLDNQNTLIKESNLINSKCQKILTSSISKPYFIPISIFPHIHSNYFSFFIL